MNTSIDRSTLVFIDSSVEDYHTLVEGVVAGAEVIVLNQSHDGIEQITSVLSQRSHLQTVHLVSHGSPGTLQFGCSSLTLDTLDTYRASLQRWFFRETERILPQATQPELLLYGCNVGAGDRGAEFITRLKQLTGAKIAASSDRTGNSDLGGNWTLDVTSDPITSPLAFSAAAQKTYASVLATPTVSAISLGSANPTNGGFVLYQIGFDAAVSGVDVSDFNLTSNGVSGAGIAAVTPITSSFYLVIVNTGTGNGTLRLDLIDDNTIVNGIDPLGGVAAGDGDFSGQTYTIDKDPLTADILNVSPDPRNSSLDSITIQFNKAITGLDLGDLTLTRSGTPINLAGTTLTTTNGITWILGGLTSLTNSNGSYQLVLTASGSGIIDPSGGGLSANASDTWVADFVSPTVTINQAAGQLDPTAVPSIDFEVVFSEAVTGFTAADISLAGTAGATTATVIGSGTTYTVAVSGMTGNGTVTATIPANSVTDAAGNFNTSSTSIDNTVSFDNLPPSIASISPAAITPTNAANVTYTVTFNQPVTGVDVSDFSLVPTGSFTGTSLTSVSGSGSSYSVTVNTGSGDGTLGLNLVDDDSIVNGSSIPLGGAGAGNGNATGLLYTLDRTAPTVTVNQAIAQADPTSTEPVQFSVVFSEAVTGFTAAAVSLSGTAGATTATVTGSGTTYAVAVSGMTGSGTVIANVLPSGAIDGAGNANDASTTTDNTIIYALPPVVSALNRVNANPTNASSVDYTVSFNEAVSGVDLTDFALSGTGATGASVTAIAGSGSSYTVTVTTGSSGLLELRLVDDDTITNGSGVALGGTGAGNGNFTGATYTIDKTVPVVDIIDVTEPRNTSVNFITIQFNEAIAGFDSADLSLTRNGTPIALTSATLTTTNTITWSLGNLASLTSTAGTYQLSLTSQGSGITDSSGNPLIANASDTWTTSIPASIYSFSAATYAVIEGNTTTTTDVVAVARTGDTSLASSVDVILAAAGTNPATPDTDVSPNSITLNFAAGEVSKQVPIQLLGDTTVEADETVGLSFANISAGGTAGSQAIAVLTIRNDDRESTSNSGGNLGGITPSNPDNKDNIPDNSDNTPDKPDNKGGKPPRRQQGVRLFGTRFSDLLRGSRYADVLVGRSGNDRLRGFGGHDDLFGRNGNDSLVGDAGNDSLHGQAGNDVLVGGRGNDRLSGGAGQDLLKDTSGDDMLSGGNGNDVLIGGIGADILTGGSGRDRFVYEQLEPADDVITDFDPQLDVIDLRKIFKNVSQLTPEVFGEYIGFVESSQGTAIYVNVNGINGSAAVEPLTILQNVTAASLSSDIILLH